MATVRAFFARSSISPDWVVRVRSESLIINDAMTPAVMTPMTRRTITISMSVKPFFKCDSPRRGGGTRCLGCKLRCNFMMFLVIPQAHGLRKRLLETRYVSPEKTCRHRCFLVHQGPKCRFRTHWYLFYQGCGSGKEHPMDRLERLLCLRLTNVSGREGRMV